MRSPKVSKAPGPNGIPNRALKHLPQRAVSFLAEIVNAVLRAYHFPTVWKHARVISVLKPGKDPALPSSYRPISLLDTTGKLFENILLTRILHAVRESGLIRDEQFGFRPRHSASLQLARLFKRLTWNFGEKRLTGAYNLILLQESVDRSVLPDGHIIWSRHAGWGSPGWIDLPSPVQSVCQRHALTLAPRLVGPLRGRHGHHSNVPQADAARQLPGVIP